MALADRAVDELRASGGRLRRVALSGLESLTPSELRVARLAASGRTNREIASELFLSVSTIEMHMTRLLRKLDIASRADLPQELTAGKAAAGSNDAITSVSPQPSSR
jgi:DNA-binding CsgD family transcriptional regulator